MTPSEQLSGYIVSGTVFGLIYLMLGFFQAAADEEHWAARVEQHGNPWRLPFPHRPLQYLYRLSNPGYWFAWIFVALFAVLGCVNDRLKLW